MNRISFLPLILLGFLLSLTPLSAQKGGILGKKAELWGADHWIHLPESKTNLNPSDFEGKVLYLYCFQSWCPGCHSSGFPTLKKVSEHYKDDDEVAFVSIQTVFEGFGTNTPEQVSAMAKRYGFSFPMGHSGAKDSASVLMKNYRTRGTPWTIIIDKKGVVRYNDFHVTEKKAKALIDTLKKS